MKKIENKIVTREEWLVKCTNDLRDKLGAVRGNIRLSKGTHLNLPPARVIIVDCKIGIDNETGGTEEL